MSVQPDLAATGDELGGPAPMNTAPVPRRVWDALRLPPWPAGPAALVVLAGLPGTGKSHLAAAVAAHVQWSSSARIRCVRRSFRSRLPR